MIGFFIVAIKFILLFGFLVLIHEGGHCIVAKLCKVRVPEFSIGFGPKLFKKQIGETVYSLRAIPLGGFVRLEGEEEASDNEGSFSNKTIPQKIAIVLAGAVVNIAFGLVTYFILVSSTASYVSNEVYKLEPGYNAEAAGIMPKDRIVKINDKTIHIKKDIDEALAKCNGNEVELELNRDGKYIRLKVLPKEEVDQNTGKSRYLIGVELAKAKNDFFSNITYGFWNTVDFSKSILENLKRLFTGGISTDQLTGPIGITTMVVRTDGFVEFIYLLALVSLALGITNILPIPPLDGWKVILYIIEGIRRKPMNIRTQANIEALGFAFMIVLSIYVAYNDILRI